MDCGDGGAGSGARNEGKSGKVARVRFWLEVARWEAMTAACWVVHAVATDTWQPFTPEAVPLSDGRIVRSL